MASAGNHRSCYVSLIDSRTLQSKCLYFPSPEVWETEDDIFSIYALINRFGSLNRRRFILALNTRSCYECTFTHNGIDRFVGLYSTDFFGDCWSHMLVLRDSRCLSAHADQCRTPSAAEFSVREALSIIHSYNRLAANNLLTETPTVIRQYLDRADNLCDRLMELIGGRLL